MSYAIFFSDEGNKLTLRLPVNPEEIEITQEQEHKTFNLMGIGEVGVPTHLNLTQINFEAEFPANPLPYVETGKGFKDAEYYKEQFETWRKTNLPLRVIIHNGIYKGINMLVIIESLTIKEKAGEEGDYYISFQLKEYRHYDIKTMKIVPDKVAPTKQVIKTMPKRPANPPKPPHNMHIIKMGDTLWAIAKRYLGDGARYSELHKINKPPLGGNPNLIYPGQKIRIP